ncbi:MAG TPA: DUF1508 domain-containing protein [Trebonia sp.]|jgi:hypothetical protein
MSGKFVLKKGEGGKFHFNLLAGNGEVIATSQHYHSKESAALHGIKSVQANAADATVDDQTEAEHARGRP